MLKLIQNASPWSAARTTKAIWTVNPDFGAIPPVKLSRLNYLDLDLDSVFWNMKGWHQAQQPKYCYTWPPFYKSPEASQSRRAGSQSASRTWSPQVTTNHSSCHSLINMMMISKSEDDSTDLFVEKPRGQYNQGFPPWSTQVPACRMRFQLICFD